MPKSDLGEPAHEAAQSAKRLPDHRRPRHRRVLAGAVGDFTPPPSQHDPFGKLSPSARGAVAVSL